MITPAEQRIELALNRIAGYGPRLDHLRMYLCAGGYRDAVKVLAELETTLDATVDILENGI